MHKLYFLPSFLVCILLLTGCPSLRIKEQPKAKFEVSEIPLASRNCECPNATRYMVTNKGVKGKLLGTEYIREVQADVPTPQPIDQMLDTGQSYTLACSVQLNASTKQCTKQVVSVLDGLGVYGGSLDSMGDGIVISLAKADMQHMPTSPGPNGQCASLCKTLNSPDCLYFNATKAGSVDLAKQIALLLNQTKTKIPNADITKLIASGKNECLRTDIVFEGVRGYNYGFRDCVIQAKLTDANRTPLSIVIPKTLAFDHNLGQGGNFSVIFANQLTAPNLEFSGPLQNSLGGFVLQVDYDAGSYVIETASHACMSIQVQ